MSVYAPASSAARRPGLAAGSNDELTPCKNAWESQKHSLSRIHSEWFHNVLFVHGWQDSNIDMGQVRAFSMAERGRGNRKFNMTLRIILQQKAIYSQIPHTFEARPMTADEFDIEGAAFATDLINWAKIEHRIQRVESRNLDLMLKMGNSVLFTGWDPNGGKIVADSETGMPKPTGCPIMLADNPVRWIWDPRATHYSEALWAIRRTEQTQEWLWSTFPDQAPKVPFARRGQRGGMAGPDYWERALQDWMTGSTVLPEGQASFILYEYFEVPTRDNPQGRLVVAAGDSGGPNFVLHAGPNVYGKIPAVVFSQIEVPGSIWGECLVPHLKDPQIEFNIRNRQISRNCDQVSNSKVVVASSGPSDEEITDEVGGILREPDMVVGSTRVLAYPSLPDQVFVQRNAALEYMNGIAAPGGADYLTRMSDVRSAIQFAQVQEREHLMLSPQIANHVQCWEDVWTNELDNCRRFGADEYEFAWLGTANEPKKRLFSEWTRSTNMLVKYTNDTPMPMSRMATTAKIIEAGGAGFINLDDEFERTKALQEMQLGSFVRVPRDATVHIRKAQENLMRVRLGEPPIAPDTMDNLDAHLQVYNDFMADTEFRDIERKQPLVAMAIRMMEGAFRQAKLVQLQMMMAAAQQMGAQQQQGGQGGGGNARAQQRQAGRTAPQNPKGTQGFGQNPNPSENQGGPLN